VLNDKNSTKYLLITLEYPPFKGGVGHYYFNMVSSVAKAMANKGDSIKVISNNENKLVDKTRSFLKWWPAVKTLHLELKRGEADYVLVGHLLPLGTVAWMLSFVYKFKYCVFLHGYDLNIALAQPRKSALAKAILNKADKIICANSYIEAEVKKIISTADLNKVALVNPGIEGETVVYNEGKIEALKNRYNLAEKTVLLTVGRLVKRKGVDIALEALKIALKQAPELVYIVIGQGEEEANLRAKIADLGQSGQVQILTDIDDEAKMNWYKLADIFIMTARQIGADMEGFGIVYLEAGLAGKPVIAGKSGGVADAVEDNVNGLLVDPTNPEQIAEAIIKLAKYERLRQRLGDEGRRRALTMFSWKKQAEKIYNIISK
jgi:phosphatidylinositol alpha-1,6-mannosyltransferase